MPPSETKSPQDRKLQAVTEMLKATLNICMMYGMQKHRVKQICDAMIELHDWKDEQ